MNIRSARDADRQAIAALQARSWQDAYSDVLPAEYLVHQIADDLERHWRELKIHPNDVVLVAEEKRLVGFIAVWCRPEPFFDNLHVRPSLRSRGIGSALMKTAAQQLVRQGHRTGYLWVVENNRRAIRFYERLGGVCTDTAEKDLFGHKVRTVMIEWDDISVIYEARWQFGAPA